MTNRIQRLRRKLGVKRTDDPDGVLAVLQVSRRLISEGDLAVYSVLMDAVRMAAPKDDAIAWWAAHYALTHQIPTGYRTLGEYCCVADQEKLLELFDAAIKNQGTLNVVVRKGKTSE